jgi:hypothetical protein
LLLKGKEAHSEWSGLLSLRYFRLTVFLRLSDKEAGAMLLQC